MLILASTATVFSLQTTLNTPKKIVSLTDEHGCKAETQTWCDILSSCIDYGALCELAPPSPNPDKLKSVVDEIEKLTRLALKETQQVSIPWSVNGTGEKDKISINGREYSFEKITDAYDKLAKAFEQTGFALDRFNVTTDTKGSVTGYRLDDLICLLSTVDASLKCGELPVNLDIENDDDKMILGLLSQELELESDKINLSYANKTDTRARGYVTASGATRTFLAAKQEGLWKMVYVGGGDFSCEEVEPYNFPEYMVDDCQTN
ncbi:hypothetical protein C4564_04095 [Candidatus Microgenomates bacterium]|nr:MAG: hypothetical protein C4564_04095 [Candidatus Microgenomates bacterium]